MERSGARRRARRLTPMVALRARALLAKGGFTLSKIVPTESPLAVIEARPA